MNDKEEKLDCPSQIVVNLKSYIAITLTSSVPNDYHFNFFILILAFTLNFSVPNDYHFNVFNPTLLLL